MRTLHLLSSQSIACFIMTCALMSAPSHAATTAPAAASKVAPSPQIQTAPTNAAPVPTPVPPVNAVTPAPMPAQSSPTQAQRHEGRLKTLHENLKLSPAQDKLWDNVTHIMQDNQSKMNALTSALAETNGVIDALKLNQKMTETRAMGLKSLLPAVEAFYKTLDAEQKKLLDSDLLPPMPHLASRPTFGGQPTP